MLKYILQKLGYSHEVPKPISVKQVALHSIIPNNEFLDYISANRHPSIDCLSPIATLLPYTLIDYICAGFKAAILDESVNGKYDKLINRKFTDKRLINIPSEPMGDLEFLRLLQDTVFELDKHKVLSPYILLKSTDIILNSLASSNMTKVAKISSLPIDIITDIRHIQLLCDFADENGELVNLFSLDFVKQDSVWNIEKIYSVKMFNILKPFELFMYTWCVILKDIDQVLNRKVRRINGVVDVGSVYHTRTKIDISTALYNAALLIDSEADAQGFESQSILTILKDNNLILSSDTKDYRLALGVLSNTGTLRKIIV